MRGYMVRRQMAAVMATVLGLALAVVSLPNAVHAASAETAGGGDFVRLSPEARVLDTRSGVGAAAGLRGAGTTTTFQVLGVGGVPSAGVSAVLVDVTAISPTAATFLTLWPGDGSARPAPLSMLNAGIGQVISNSAVVPVSASGKLAVYNHAGSVHIAVDVQGYFTTESAGAGGGFVSVTPTRVVDTRSGLGGSTGKIPAHGGSRTFTLTGGVIPAGAAAAFLDVIAVGATSYGWIGTYPPESANTSSVMDYVPGTTSVGVSAKLGSDGRVTFTNNGASTIDLVLTAEGYFTSTPASGAGFRTMSATRLLDTRTTNGGAAIPANGTIDVPLGLPVNGTAGAVLNFTVVNNTAGGFLRVWPLGGMETSPSLVDYPNPNTSARSSLAIVRPGTDGKIRIRNVSSGTVHVLVDLQGWFADPNTAPPPLPVEQFARASAMQASPAPGASVGTLEYAYTDNIGQLVHGHQSDPDNFGSVQWTTISGLEAFSGQPGLVEQADGRLQVIGHNITENTWVRPQATKTLPVWGSWINLGGLMASHPSVARQTDGSLVLFAIDANGVLWTLPQASANGAYGSWSSLDLTGLTGTPVAVSVGNGIRIFVRDTSGALRTALYANGALSGSASLGGSGLTGSHAVVVSPGSRLRVFARTADGSIVTQQQDLNGVFPGVWDPVGTFTAAGSPSALLSPTSGKVEVVARAADGAIFSTGETVQGSGVWRDWAKAQPDGDTFVAATDPTVFPITNSSGSTWAFVARDSDNASRVYTASSGGGLSALAANDAGSLSFTSHTLPAPPR